MRKDIFKADFFWPLASFSLIAMVFLLGAVFGLVRQFDLAATQREQTVVENGLLGRIEEAAQVVNTEGMWDDAVVNLDHTYNPAWAKANVSEFLWQNNGFRHSFVLDSKDGVIFAATKGDPVGLETFKAFSGFVAPLVARIRLAEQARGPFDGSYSGRLISRPIHASSVAAVGGEYFIVSVTLVQPDFGTALPKGPRAPVLVSALPMDEAFLKAFAHRFLLSNLHVDGDDTRNDLDEGHVGVRDSTGRYVATLDWTPQNPGQALLKRLIAPILTIMACLAGIVLILYRGTRRMAQGLIASEARAAHLAYYDPLTGLPNRVQFFDKLGQSLGQISRGHGAVAVLCIDLDRFKEVNDTYGHHVGDELIREAGRRLSAQCRSCDTFYRLSGDEFAIVQVQAEAKGGGALADRLVRTLAEPIQLGSGMVFAGCSIGIAVISASGVEPEEAFRQADLALYRAKASGKGQFAFFESEMDAAIKTRRALEGDLRLALAAGDLQMNYQPQVNHRDQMTGVEALVRWNHPERGMVSPAFFVPIAEECGLIGELGLFTLRRAFEDSHRWPGLRVSINVSASQLRMKDFVPRVEALLKEQKVDPFNFELEITEGLLLGDDPATHETLRRLRGIGFQLALDDFGTGYSSLSYLQRYPINKIKIDRSFISNLGWDSEAGAVVGAIVKLARALKLQVIAEGVETDVQRSELIAVGCSDIQGYLFSRPVGAEDIERLRRVPVRPARRMAS